MTRQTRQSGVRPRRRRRLKDFPVCLQLEGAPVLVVGAGAVAARRIGALLRAGARVTVVAKEASRSVAELAGRGRLSLRRRAFRAGDLRRASMVFAATDDRAVNRAVASEARRAGKPVNAADDPLACAFTMPAVARVGAFTLAVSSDGTDPALAARLRDALGRRLRHLVERRNP